MADTKIMLVIAGGVSLGSYEAGALTEILYALEYLNEQQDSDRYVIDVATGGSAGSITAALVTRIIMHDYPGMRHLLHEAWVQRADIGELMRRPGPNGLLSERLMTELAKDYLHHSRKFPLEESNAARCSPDVMRLAFSMSNLVGVDYGVRFQRPVDGGPKEFVSTFFSDFAEHKIDRNEPRDDDLWKSIAETAIASGSFPIAFPPKLVHREKEHYRGATMESTEILPSDIGLSMAVCSTMSR